MNSLVGTGTAYVVTRILIADESPINSKSAVCLLEKSGYDVFHAKNVRELIFQVGNDGFAGLLNIQGLVIQQGLPCSQKSCDQPQTDAEGRPKIESAFYKYIRSKFPSVPLVIYTKNKDALSKLKILENGDCDVMFLETDVFFNRSTVDKIKVFFTSRQRS